MQKCPACGSINADHDNTCGVCGADLSAALRIDEESLDTAPPTTAPPSQRRLKKTALLALLTGPVLAIIGVLLAFNLLNTGSALLSLSGIILLLLGLLTITFTVSLGPSFQAWFEDRTGQRGGKFINPVYRPMGRANKQFLKSPEESGEDYRTREERQKEDYD